MVRIVVPYFVVLVAAQGVACRLRMLPPQPNVGGVPGSMRQVPPSSPTPPLPSQ